MQWQTACQLSNLTSSVAIRSVVSLRQKNLMMGAAISCGG